MAQSKHKYRVSVYLGKDIYTELEKQAFVFGISVASLTKLLIETGFAFGKTMEKGERRKEVLDNGK